MRVGDFTSNEFALTDQNSTRDRTTVVFDGASPDRLACDTTLRCMPDDSWIMVMLGGGNTEPLPQNRVFITRSVDQGKTWSAMEPLDLGIKSKTPDVALVPTELMVLHNRCTMFVATHDGKFLHWKAWMTHSYNWGNNWSPLEPVPGRLHNRTFVRNRITTRDGRILLPFQHYLGKATKNPRNGVLTSHDQGQTWTEYGNVRLSSNDDYHGWAENNIVELSDGRIAMIIRADGLNGVLYYAESKDSGYSWPELATPTTIPNPGSKATLYSLADNAIGLLHNPNPEHRSPLALWVSFDDMKTWSYQRVLIAQSVDGTGGCLNYPDGFVSADKRWLHFAYDDNRHRAVYFGANLPELPPQSVITNPN